MNEYIKNFDLWNDKKKLIEAESQRVSTFSEKEIWWVFLGLNIGREIDSKNQDYIRPALIIKKLSLDTLWIIPISRTTKKGSYFHTVNLEYRKQTILLLQLRMISAKRLLKRIVEIDELEFITIIDKIKCLLPK